MSEEPTLHLFHLDNYSFGSSQRIAGFAEDLPAVKQMEQLEAEYNKTGMARQSVSAVLLAHDHGHPHVLLLKLSDNPPTFKLPGDIITEGCDPRATLAAALLKYFAAPSDQEEITWDIGDCLARWCRTDFVSYTVS